MCRAFPRPCFSSILAPKSFKCLSKMGLIARGLGLASGRDLWSAHGWGRGRRYTVPPGMGVTAWAGVGCLRSATAGPRFLPLAFECVPKTFAGRAEDERQIKMEQAVPILRGGQSPSFVGG